MLTLYYNGINSFLFVNAVKMYQFKPKISEVKPYSSCQDIYIYIYIYIYIGRFCK